MVVVGAKRVEVDLAWEGYRGLKRWGEWCTTGFSRSEIYLAGRLQLYAGVSRHCARTSPENEISKCDVLFLDRSKIFMLKIR